MNENFPTIVSFTVTNRCNLRCRMCGQWSETGYIKNRNTTPQELQLQEWLALADQLADHKLPWLLIRGGEPFLMPGIMELLRHLNQSGIYTSIDTNGTLLEKFAARLAQLDKLHLTISIDGPPDVHDAVRGVPGCFAQLHRGIKELHRQEDITGKHLSLGVCCTISKFSYQSLALLPQTARQLGVDSITIVPYYYVPEAAGKEYDTILQQQFGCPGFSWCGFHHEESGVPVNEFLPQLQAYKYNLQGLTNYPYLPLNEQEYTTWFSDPLAPVGDSACSNIEKLLDIQPDGRANFCVDFPDFSPGNIREQSIAEIWNSSVAEKFRDYRRRQPLPVCHRCGAKYISVERV